MELATIAVTVATLLATKAAEALGGEAGKGIWSGIQGIYDAIRAKFAGDDEGSEVLQRVENKPSSQARVAELAEVLEARMKEDRDFAQQLDELVSAAEQDPATGKFVVTVRDNAKVGKITNIDTIYGGARF